MRYEEYFIGNSSVYSETVQQSSQVIKDFFLNQSRPYSAEKPSAILDSLKAIPFIPQQEQPLEKVIKEVSNSIVKHAISVNNSQCLAHLHCPVLISSLAAEVIISALNQSMDSYDQASSATMLEQYVIDNLAKLYGYSTEADGIFTSGGTQSNFMGLLLARDYYCQNYLKWDIRKEGLPLEAKKFKILCSEVAHFSVRKSVEILGLGYGAVIPIQTDKNYCMDVAVLEQFIKDLKERGEIPIAISATSGTTDFGSFDNIKQIAEIAEQYKIWLHVDAAYGGGLILTSHYRYLLDGIEKADSITIDFHKLFYQAISCGSFLVKDKSRFNLIKLHSSYLNPEDNQDYGILDLAYKSIQTTRRFDALKVFMSFQALGYKLGEMIEYTIGLSKQVFDLLEQNPYFEVAQKPSINSIVFRFNPKNQDNEILNFINKEVKLRLLLTGEAIIGQTIIKGSNYLKFTLLNPVATFADIERLVKKIEESCFFICQEFLLK